MRGAKPDAGPRVNHRIRAKQVRVVGPDGDQLGIMDSRDAIKAAEEQGLDLVEVAANAKPPVCRIMDYGKYKYEQKKKAAEAKRNATTTKLKEVKMRPKTDDHDFNFKIEHAKRFLNDGDKVKVTIMFRGREITHQEVARRLLDRAVEALKELATIEAKPKMEGRNMFLILAPIKAKQPAGKSDGKTGQPAAEPKSERDALSIEPEVEVKRSLKKKTTKKATKKTAKKAAKKTATKKATKKTAKSAESAAETK